MSDATIRTIPGGLHDLSHLPNLPSGVVGGRPSVIQLVFREKSALYAAYIPLMSDGGLFVPTTRDYQLGEDLYLLLSLPGDPQRYPVAGKIGWITPANASGGRTQGVGVRFPADEKARALKIKIEEVLGTVDLVEQTDADDLIAPHAAPAPAASRVHRSRRPRRRVSHVLRFALPPELSRTAGATGRISARRWPRRRSTARCASAPRSRNSIRCTRSRWPTTTCGPAPAFIRTTRASREPDARRPAGTGGAAQGGRDRRNRARLLPPRRAQHRRHGMAARALSHPHRSRPAQTRTAADHPYPQRIGRYAGDPARGGRRQRRLPLLHRDRWRPRAQRSTWASTSRFRAS